MYRWGVNAPRSDTLPEQGAVAGLPLGGILKESKLPKEEAVDISLPTKLQLPSFGLK